MPCSTPWATGGWLVQLFSEGKGFWFHRDPSHLLTVASLCNLGCLDRFVSYQEKSTEWSSTSTYILFLTSFCFALLNLTLNSDLKKKHRLIFLFWHLRSSLTGHHSQFTDWTELLITCVKTAVRIDHSLPGQQILTQCDFPPDRQIRSSSQCQFSGKACVFAKADCK